MKFITFALAAIAFSGSSSKSREEADAKPAKPTEPVPTPLPTIDPPPPNSEPVVELSEEEKADPVVAFDAIAEKVYGFSTTLSPFKRKVDALEKELVDAKATATKATESREKAEKSYNAWISIGADDKENKLNQRKRELDDKQKEEEEAKAFVKTLDSRIIEAKNAFNKVFDQMLAADHELRSKGTLLVQRADEIAESEKQNVKEAGEAFAEIEKALEKQMKILKNLDKLQFKPETVEKAKNEANKKIALHTADRLKSEESLRNAEEKSATASKRAKDLEKKRLRQAKFLDSFFKTNQYKRY